MVDAIDPAAVSPLLRDLAQRVGLAMLDALRDPRTEAALPSELARTLRGIAGLPPVAEHDDRAPSIARITRRVDPVDGDALPPLADDLLSVPGHRSAMPGLAIDAPPIAPRATRWQRYERGERLWQRGGVETWIARDRASGRPVMVDLLPAMSDDARAAVHAAADSLARAPHPNLAPLIAHGDEDGACHLVWESLPGETLENLLARDVRMSPFDAIRLVAQMAQALLHAHAVTGRAHGDLRPARLMLAYPRRGDAAAAEGERLVIGGLLAPSPRWYDAGACAGVAPLYVAPERLRVAREPDLAADIYALGGILHHLLTGHPPYDGGAEVVRLGHLHGPVPDPGRWRPELPNTVRLLVSTALAKSPEGRFLSHRGFLVACEKALTTIGPLRRPSVRILRKAMPEVVAVPRGDLVIAPEFADDDHLAQAEPKVVTTRHVRREAWIGAPIRPWKPAAATPTPEPIAAAPAIEPGDPVMDDSTDLGVIGEPTPPEQMVVVHRDRSGDAPSAGDRTAGDRTTLVLPALTEEPAAPRTVPPQERTTALLPAFDAAAAAARIPPMAAMAATPASLAPTVPIAAPRRLAIAFGGHGGSETEADAAQRRFMLRVMGASVAFGCTVGILAWLALRVLVH